MKGAVISMWGRFSRKEQDISAVQKVLGRFRRSRSARREEVVYGNAGRLGFVIVLILVIISLAFWLLRRRTREETAPVPVEAEEEAVLLEDEEEVVVPPPGAPSAEDVVAPREDPPVGDEVSQIIDWLLGTDDDKSEEQDTASQT